MPASCVPYAPEAQGSLPWEGTAVRAPYAFQPRACRAYRTLWRHRLHETSDGRKAQAHPPRAGQCAFRRRWRTWLDSESGARARLNAMFRAFVEGEVARHFGEPVVYQARCHTLPRLYLPWLHLMRAGRPPGRPHAAGAHRGHRPSARGAACRRGLLPPGTHSLLSPHTTPNPCTTHCAHHTTPTVNAACYLVPLLYYLLLTAYCAHHTYCAHYLLLTTHYLLLTTYCSLLLLAYTSRRSSTIGCRSPCAGARTRSGAPRATAATRTRTLRPTPAHCQP